MSVYARISRISAKVLAQLERALLAPRARRTVATHQLDPGQHIPFAVYFADVPSSAYQLHQWLRPFESLNDASGPVAVMIRHPTVVETIARQTKLHVLFADRFSLVEEFVARHDVRVIFYVNNSQSNFTTLRLNGPVHVHLSHGESEKASMYSNQLKAYDYVFVAGEASAERILTHVRGIDPSHLVRIGRPQLDVPLEEPVREIDTLHKIMVLYSPTWEGDSPQMAHGSLVTHGAPLIETLISDPRFRIVFRAHSKTGTQSARHRAALTAVKRTLSKPASTSAGHLLDREPDAARSIARADVVVADVSAMAMDALGMDKPLVLCLPKLPDTSALAARITTWVTSVPEDAANQLARLANGPVPAAQAAYRNEVFATETPSQAVALFVIEATRVARRQAGQAV